MAERVVVLGGARSGKSAVAQDLVAGAAQVLYVATGTPGDAEQAERIAAHRAARPPGWLTVETRDLTAAVRAAPVGSAVLVDALAPWLAAQMTAHGLWADPGATVAPLGAAGRAAADAVLAEADAFWAAAAAHPGGPVVLVADESGLGVTPADPSSRRWLDLAGEVVQHLAARADRALLVVAGRPLQLPAPPGPPSPPAVGGHVDLAAHGDRMVPDGTIDFAVNVWGDGPPAHLRAALAAALDDVGRYPDLGAARAARPPPATAATRPTCSSPRAPRRCSACCPPPPASASPRSSTPPSPNRRPPCAPPAWR